MCSPCYALQASWYDMASLKKEGTYKRTGGIMANNKRFDENAMTCASRHHKLGTRLRITHIKTGKSIIVKVTDRIAKRFKHKRIDLTKAAFKKLAKLDKGIIKIKCEVIK